MIARTEKKLRTDVNRTVVFRAQVNRRIPVVAELLFVVLRQRLDVARFMSLAVNSRDLAALILSVDVIGIGRIGKHPEAVATIHVFPTAIGDAPRILGVANPGAVVLQPTVDVIRHIHVYTDVIKLRDRQVLSFPPAITAVIRVPDTTIVAGDQVIGIVWIDPDVVEVAVRAARNVAETLAAIVADDEWTIRLVNFLFVFWIDDQVGEVKRTPDHVLAAILRSPRLPAIIGTIQTVLGSLRFDKRIDNLRLRRSYRNRYPAPRFGWQIFRALFIELGP